MDSYSIQFIAQPQKGQKITWTLSRCSNIYTVKKRLWRIRQLVTLIAGPNSDILSELTDWENITQSCNPIWKRTITISDSRAYTFLINLSNKQALITAKSQGRPLRKIGLPKAINMASYKNVIGLMCILIRLLEGNNSPYEEWVEDMADGKTKPCQDRDNDIGIESLFNIFSNLQQPQAQSLIAAHPPEINIYTSPSSYKIIITRH
jgi:hypothetical protein